MDTETQNMQTGECNTKILAKVGAMRPVSQGAPRTASHQHRLGKRHGADPPRSLQRAQGPAKALILDLGSPGLKENKFVVFKPHRAVVLCYGSPRKLVA